MSAAAVGTTVHYVAHGTPVREDGTQAFPSVCRAAIITEVDPPNTGEPTDFAVGLAVLNPSGAFFDRHVPHHPGDPALSAPGARCGTRGRAYPGGTWHPVEGDTT